VRVKELLENPSLLLFGKDPLKKSPGNINYTEQHIFSYGCHPSRLFFSNDRYHSHINTSTKLIEAYKGDAPFNQFLKQFFAIEKKFGSRDRKQISSLCFSWFRLGLAFDKQLQEEKPFSGLFFMPERT
jgi:hypothetical protein